MRSPDPDSWSSSSEYPKKPLNIARISIVSPTIQLISRGRRNAPVKKTRQRWAKIVARNTSAAQWWAWRITSPARTSNDKRMADSYALDIVTPSRGW